MGRGCYLAKVLSGVEESFGPDQECKHGAGGEEAMHKNLPRVPCSLQDGDMILSLSKEQYTQLTIKLETNIRGEAMGGGSSNILFQNKSWKPTYKHRADASEHNNKIKSRATVACKTGQV